MVVSAVPRHQTAPEHDADEPLIVRQLGVLGSLQGWCRGSGGGGARLGRARWLTVRRRESLSQPELSGSPQQDV
ncbi:hypothetical protein FJT64_006274 [Amphibalanus amphitrite]|uniref:Uncharacterized protein n=1 Tax=Amphibalanus amphitrite TaxID=1232801 RepID=A0A6A4W2J6_AMPAM|nr:hypothetical protein FJT64_006274 [Amphibalanus amphitrite]